MPVGPVGGPRTGLLGVPGAVASGSTRRSPWGPIEGPIRDLCLRLKHERNAWLAPWLADSWSRPGPRLAPGRRTPGSCRSRCTGGGGWRRGYNQAEALARRLARRLGLPRPRPLRRVVATPPLARLGRTERAEVMRDAFRARRGSAACKGRTVLLVDDILTTGATCGAAARALKRAGAARVVVVGRSVEPKGSP